jgi:hypothetical protein
MQLLLAPQVEFGGHVKPLQLVGLTPQLTGTVMTQG